MSVRKRNWSVKGVAKSAWVVDYVDSKGKRHQPHFAKKREADAYELKVQTELKQGIHTADKDSITISQAALLWYETGEANKLERSTLRPYRNHVDLHILPLLGDIKLSRLTTPTIELFKTELLKTRTHAMATKVLSSLKMLLTDMQRRGLVVVNVALPVKISGRSRDKDECVVPTKAHMTLILREAHRQGGMAAAIFLTAAFTGMRSGELRGLRWGAIDLEKRAIKVGVRADQWGTMGSPKSAAGRREIPIAPVVANALAAWQEICPKNKAGYLGLAFPNGKGKVENHSNIVNRIFDPLQIRAGVIARDEIEVELADGRGCRVVARYGFHSMRHFYASTIIEQRFLPKRVQELLGHGSLQMTYDTYGHLFPDADEDAAKIEKAAVFYVVEKDLNTLGSPDAT